MDLLVCLKDLESRHHLRKRYAAILLPILHFLLALREDNEAVRFALVDHFGLRSVSTRHGGWYWLVGCLGEWEGVRLEG